MEGTIRALDEDMRQLIFKRLETIVQNTAESNGAEATLTIHKGYPITYNDPDLTAMMAPTLNEVTNGNAVVIDAITGAEDFSFFQKEIPGLYFFVGDKVPDRAPAGHHTPDFMLDERGMKTGVKAMSNLVVDYMNQAGM
jgi:amidohydrolase